MSAAVLTLGATGYAPDESSEDPEIPKSAARSASSPVARGCADELDSTKPGSADRAALSDPNPRPAGSPPNVPLIPRSESSPIHLLFPVELEPAPRRPAPAVDTADTPDDPGIVSIRSSGSANKNARSAAVLSPELVLESSNPSSCRVLSPMLSLMRDFACAIAALAFSFVARITDPNDASAARESPLRKLFIDLVKSLFAEAAFFGLGPAAFSFSGVPSGENGDWTEAGGCPPPGGAFGWGLWASNVAADSAAVIAAASSTSTSANPFSPTPALAPPNPFGGASASLATLPNPPPPADANSAPSTQKPTPSATERHGTGPSDRSGMRPGSDQTRSRPLDETAANAAGRTRPLPTVTDACEEPVVSSPSPVITSSVSSDESSSSGATGATSAANTRGSSAVEAFFTVCRSPLAAPCAG